MKYQFMPMFWGDFFANTLHLSAQEVGAYVLLIAHAWEHNGCIPCAHAQRIARVNNFHWANVREVLEPFFEIRGGTSDVPHRMYYHGRVHRELTSAAEISNKRKDAALQMHSKSRANGYASHHASTTTTTFRDTSLGKGSRGMSPDLGNDYRSPPKAKSDNVLAPLPEKRGSR